MLIINKVFPLQNETRSRLQKHTNIEYLSLINYLYMY